MPVVRPGTPKSRRDQHEEHFDRLTALLPTREG
ncbi:hypothetical protein FHX42_005108 [Saccharopolyspora lacisalsi]|uniref:Uncharacterized protein n=1 Tax=Halosaccharopolyspora lacisalsi TaxID=1000566 RepID=A0A839E340_9PSEU|nr:hypothetical protein [Halosaccharopolyspora lacisalsi]